MANKRANPPRAADFTREFIKDWVRLSGTGRYNMGQLKEAMLLLVANDAPLAPEWRDHPLKGNWAGFRECHIGGDFLLIYQIDQQAGPWGTVIFNRIGSHSELFKE